MLTATLLAQIMLCPPSRAQRWVDALNVAMRRFGVNTPRRAAHFLAQVGHESLSLTKLEEGMSYSRLRLEEVFGRRLTAAELPSFVGQPVKLGNRVYANRNGNGNEASGDGYLYRGRGPIAVTGRSNYRHIGRLIDQPLEQMPQLLLNPEVGALASAAYWQDACLNTLADQGDVLPISRRINLGSATSRAIPNGLDDRRQRTERALRVLGAR
ncbi:glycoside hydrolase family 19 protein [Xanthomonas sp. 60]